MAEGVIRLNLRGGSKVPLEPPGYLRTRGRAWWVSMVEQYEFTAADLHVLAAAARELDIEDIARRRARKDGHFIRDRFGFVTEHPAIAMEGRAQDRHERFRRALNLDSRPRANELPRNKRAAYR